MGKRKGLWAASLTLLLTSLLCLGLYHLDNKYTHPATQPISGVLFYEEDGLCWLTRQWVLYPNVLLTPSEAETYTGYRCYQDIGGESSPGTGSATYRMTLILPEEEKTYALELPEVFSSCHLYVNGSPVLQLGDPSPDTYREGLNTQVVTFPASGTTHLLLTVTDQSGVNLGLTYPPAFGSPDQVLAQREGRFLVHSAFTLLALLGCLLSLTFGLKGSQARGILTCLLCLSLAVVTGYPLYHGLLVTRVQPWYTLEPFCAYALLLLALVLQCSICGVSRRRTCLLVLPCLAGLLLTLVRFGCAAFLPAQAALVFSGLSALLKYYTAVCLLALAGWALACETPRSLLLLCGSVGLAVCLVFDRLLPLYEPIYGGWLTEWGSLLLTGSLAAALWLDAAEAHRFRLTYQESFHQMEQRLAMQRDHYQQLSHQVRLAREAGHDLRHHVRTMRTMAQQGRWRELDAYLQEYEPHVRDRQVMAWSEHPAADAILSHYAAEASQLGVSYNVRLTIPPDLPLPDAELCILLSNLLENAVDALARQTAGQRKLYLRGQYTNQQFGLVVDNTFSGELRQKNGRFLSTKRPSHGLGLSSVESIVQKYQGLADFSAEDNTFHVSLLIPLP